MAMVINISYRYDRCLLTTTVGQDASGDCEAIVSVLHRSFAI